ncbi:MAG: thioredoxin-disulfide reductase [Nitrospinae bacterium RIFCSPLOWO2_02_FULL_39_110]|nr:MAG: thioredoxin-disulfide reductase [Nitrospinae bacterium RIFCSPHIGHO2_02_39_11]OGV98659.1 MAG: thioredoxin-disulfide reductase [Nitrospinae bacterium RIFCSPHIGHO2_12_FULL_39_42]OGW01005.1 MAG: thioredoxin-disulfide reductase [Nitrospinae bacterium RIFCSPHIGHO2_02_FULL_39_82]OGW02447.1 MAG: thioredoxin-disulfide reductase [Nitrospinae bacterium RIFCSPLOWO2_02_39_17]OGW05762.1 MAG: thioredoxin-disulfide reductase [Nitrospinae bacterium RIFCSPLOWO2_02_FULL_39_110]OGW08747.1 MAG: thioredoxin
MQDLIIIGGGPAGLSAAIYALRAKMDVILIEKLGIGGQIALSDVIENYPGYRSISGSELMSKFENHAKDFGLKTEIATIERIIDAGDRKITKTDSKDFESKAVIIASGAQPKKLGIKGENEFTGRGVSYCATCDGLFFSGRDIVVVGGGDTAVKEALYLSKIVNKIYLVHRRDRLRAEKIMQEKLLSNPKVEFLWNSAVDEISGGEMGVERISVRNIQTNKKSEVKAEGIFVFVGITPETGFIDVKKNEGGFIITNDRMETSMKGVFAAGDCRNTPLRQVATAVGDGAIAAISAEEYISHLEGKSYPTRMV